AYDNAFGASVKASQAFFDLQTILPPCMRMGVITGIPSADVEMPSGDEQYILRQQSSAPNSFGSSAANNNNSAKIRITSTKSRARNSRSRTKSDDNLAAEENILTVDSSSTRPSKRHRRSSNLGPEEQAAFDSDLLAAFQAVYERRIAYDKISQKKLAIELNELSNGKTAIVQGTMSKLIRGVAVPKDQYIINAIQKWIARENSRAHKYEQQQDQMDVEPETQTSEAATKNEDEAGERKTVREKEREGESRREWDREGEKEIEKGSEKMVE
ncbi:13463_t:CDS:2, partial [Ambispora leptoticha]